MKTQSLVLITRWIRTDSLFVSWYSNNQMNYRYELKDGKVYGDSKIWSSDGLIWGHEIWDGGKRIKTIL